MATGPLPQDSTNTRTIQGFLVLNVASSVLQCGLVLTVYRFQLSSAAAWLLAPVAIAPQGVLIRSALRKRACESKFYSGAVIFSAIMVLLTALLVVMTTCFVNSLSFAMLVAGMPLTLGLLFVFFLMLPKRLFSGGGLGDVLLPVRMKLAKPALNRILRFAALYFVYTTLNFVSAFLFDGDTPPAGALAYAIALLPVLPLFGLIPIYNKYMAEEQDEFQRHLFQQSTLWAFLGTFIVASVIGRLQEHALILHRSPDFFRPYSVFPVFWWLQIEAVFVVQFIQGMRVHRQEKREKALTSGTLPQ
jgi:hypothetical protein